MSTTFYAGNDRVIGIAKQADPETPAATPTEVWRVTNFNKDPVRALAALEESDKSQQQGASHVTAFTPGFSCDLYLRASEMDLIAEALLGDNDDSATTLPSTHTATPAADSPSYTVWVIDPDGTVVYDGCKAVSATFQGQDEGQTEWRVSNLTFLALGVTEGQAQPLTDEQLDALEHDEGPLLWAETAVSYDGSHPGVTTATTINVNRNSTRVQGDNGFRAIAIVHGKFQCDGTVTRLLQDDDYQRAVDTGSKTGTDLTTDVYTESLDIVLETGAGAALRGVTFAIAEVAYTEHQRVNDYAQGRPVGEVLTFQSQPQATLATNMSIVTTNAKTTPA